MTTPNRFMLCRVSGESKRIWQSVWHRQVMTQVPLRTTINQNVLLNVDHVQAFFFQQSTGNWTGPQRDTRDMGSIREGCLDKASCQLSCIFLPPPWCQNKRTIETPSIMVLHCHLYLLLLSVSLTIFRLHKPSNLEKELSHNEHLVIYIK